MRAAWINMIASAALCLSANIGSAQSLSLDEVAIQISTSSLVNNAATIALFDLQCAPYADFDAAALTAAINTYAAVGAHQVGRDAFRKLFLETLAELQQKSERFGFDKWCSRTSEEMSASGLETAIRSRSK